MKNIRFITRADDAGSSKSANRAIARVVRAGFIKNVSVMAPAAFVDDAAYLLASNKQVCFGMHGTLNAEWDKIKWRPVSELPAGSGLADADGWFLADPSMFAVTKPPLEIVMAEYAAQLDKLTRAGFNITYVDSHMFPEVAIEGMNEAVKDFAETKGLIDHMYYYRLPRGLLDAVSHGGNMLKALRTVPDGQYFYVAHPSLDTPEMRETGNQSVSGDEVAQTRAGETKFLSQPLIKLLMRTLGIRPLRYDEAKPLVNRLTVADIVRIMGEQSEQ